MSAALETEASKFRVLTIDPGLRPLRLHIPDVPLSRGMRFSLERAARSASFWGTDIVNSAHFLYGLYGDLTNKRVIGSIGLNPNNLKGKAEDLMTRGSKFDNRDSHPSKLVSKALLMAKREKSSDGQSRVYPYDALVAVADLLSKDEVSSMLEIGKYKDQLINARSATRPDFTTERFLGMMLYATGQSFKYYTPGMGM